MYNEYEEKRNFPIRKFLITLVVVVVFVLLLVWLLPIPNMQGVNNTIFNNNVITMKEAAVNYFTVERLPKKTGEKVTLTLQEMLDLKLLLPFTDKNGDACDTSKSYVTLEKLETEYLMTVHLKCNKQEDEIKVHLGCYSYCTSALCEKQETEEKPVVNGPSCTLVVASGTKGTNGWYTSDVVVKFNSKNAANGVKITNYGIGLSTNYDGKDSYTVTKEGLTKVYGYVKDSNGKTAVCSIEVKKDTVKPVCELTVLSGTTSSNGVYISDAVVGFKTKNDATSSIATFGIGTASAANYNNKDRYTVNANGTTKVYGYVKDGAGNTNTCNISVQRNVTTSPAVSVPTCSLEVTSGTLGKNSWYVSDVVVGFKTKSSTNGAKITSFGIGTKEVYNGNTTYKVTSDGTNTIKGYVKDSNGNVATCSITIKKDTVKPTCTLEVLSGATKGIDGNYVGSVSVGFKTKKDATSGVNKFGLTTGTTANYNDKDKLTITNSGTYTVKGVVMDNAGNESTCNLTLSRVAGYEYEYSKNIAASYSAWGAWTTKEYDVNKAPAWGLSANKLVENENLGKTGSEWRYVTGKAIYQDRLVEVEGTKIKTCAGYTYYRHVDSDAKTYAIKVTDSWKYVGTQVFADEPQDNLVKKYEYVGPAWDTCNNCTSTPNSIYKVYERTVSTVTADGIKTNGVTVKCTSYVEKPVVTFSVFSTIVGYEQTRSLVDIYTYRTRTRTLLNAAYTDVKWSTYNNSSLLTQGYKMTGNYRSVK